ncbi:MULTISPECIES: thioredoxin domain-containing protein [unclassified Luteococcus]|uniref:thioredoxin domain-containing protein n=1 Tax=unclassified Luteococcus TaxID=2639923 RepID=UPI00313AF05B
MPNRLAESTSPYLQQHAHQEVDWYPWGAEAFEAARERDLPLLVSTGYAACHWCHVMAHESFDDPEIARLMNEHFVSVKVDREENPDVDAVLMAATQALTGQGGWPMTVFLTPSGEPFFAGTYFPPQPAGGQPSFRQVCEALAGAWAERRDEVLGSASSITEQLRALNPVTTSSTVPGARETLELLGKDYDMIHGGFGGAPKFPPAMVLDALLVKGDPTSLDMAQLTCEMMARGGLFDRVGGGFHRYSTDVGWVVPHFEKMLYDNALLLGSYLRCWRRTADHDGYKREVYEHAIYSTVEWLEREMRTEPVDGRPGGAFAASLDADSVDIRGMVAEGIYYLWNPELLVDALGEADGGWARQVFHVHEGGTFELGLSTLQLHGSPDQARLTAVLDRLREERGNRFPPSRDDKVVAAWNGLAIDSLVNAAMTFAEPAWLELAQDAAQAVWSVHVDQAEDRFVRTSRDGQPGTTAAVAEDHGCLALGLARLAGATGEAVWLERAVWLLERADRLFTADDGGFFDAEVSEQLFTRPRDVSDNATPSGTSSLVAALRLVGLLACRGDLTERADRAAQTTWPLVASQPRFAGWSLADALVLDEARRGLKPAQVVVVLPDDSAGIDKLAVAAWRMAPAGSAIVVGRAGTTGFGHLFDERIARDGQATGYVCRGEVCFDPISDYAELKTPLWSRC